MENPSKYLTKSICAYILDEPIAGFLQSERDVTSLVRFHNEKLKEQGDISFCSIPMIWKMKSAKCDMELREEVMAMFKNSTGEDVSEARERFLTVAKKWVFPVERFDLDKNRCVLYLQRTSIIPQLLFDVLKWGNNFGKLRKNPNRKIHLREVPTKTDCESQLSLYRSKLVRNTLRRVLQYSEWTLEQYESSDDVLELAVTSLVVKDVKDDEKACNRTYATIKCGLVKDPSTRKLAKVGTEEYIKMRSNDMRLMAMHKFGVRVKDEQQFSVLMERLGTAAATVDLLEVRFSSPVQIIRNGQGSTKGASFILYNSARIESLLRSFNERVQNTAYGELPELDDVDLSLLNEEEEWQLVYGYIFTFPNLIERCVEQLESGACATHLIVRYLSSFVSVFSVYYRRIRILTERRDHLMPYVYARVYLIKALRQILNKSLALLNIDPVSFM